MKKIEGMPFVSIVVPIFNVEHYLKDCLKSLAKQTYENFEVLMIDDGSTDDSKEICKAFEREHPNFKYFYKKNGGLSSARNYGIDVAKGDYICFIDSDDYVDSHFLLNSVNQCVKSNADICFTELIYVSEDGSVIDKESPIQDEIFDKNAVFLKLSLKQYHYYVCAVNRLYKLSLFSDIRFPEGKIHEDEFVAHRLFDKSKTFCSTSKAKYYYRQRDFSIMHSNISAKRFDAIEALLQRFNYCKENNYKKCKKRTLNLAAGVLLECMSGLDYIEHKKFFHKYFFSIYKPIYLRKMLIKLPLFFLKMVIRSFAHHLRLMKYRNISRRNKQSCFLLGTPIHGNMGDQLIVQSEKEFLLAYGFQKKQIIEIDNKLLSQCFNLVKNIVRQTDIIIIDGGGNLGDLWPWEDQKITKIIDSFSENKIIVFPQTLFFKNQSANRTTIKNNLSIYLKAKNLNVFLRDIRSFELFKEIYPGINCHLCPDIVFFYKQIINQTFSHRNYLGLCFRKDKEKVVTPCLDAFLKGVESFNGKSISTIVNKKITIRNRKREINKLLRTFGSYKWIITDRLHGMVISYLTNSNCIAIDNVSNKVTGSYDWIKKDKKIRMFSEFNDVNDALKALSNPDCTNECICFDYSNLIQLIKEELC